MKVKFSEEGELEYPQKNSHSEIEIDTVNHLIHYSIILYFPALLFKLFEPLMGKLSIQYANGPNGRKRRLFYDKSFGHEAVKEYFESFVYVSEELLPLIC